MKPCEHLSQYLDGRLERAGREYFKAHLGSCQRCRNIIDLWQSAAIGLKTEASRRWQTLTPTVEEADRLVERASLDRSSRDVWHLRTLVPVAITASVTFAAAWILFGNLGDEAAIGANPGRAVKGQGVA